MLFAESMLFWGGGDSSKFQDRDMSVEQVNR